MAVLRIALLLGFLAAPVLPAAAANDVDVFGAERSAGSVVSAESRAVEAALAAAADGGDAIEQAVLEGVKGFYAARGFEPVWFASGEASPQSLSLRGVMDAADEQGLDPSLYRTSHLVRGPIADPVRRAEAEVEFSRTLARFVTHVASGRIRPTDISAIITLEPERPDVAEILSTLSSTDTVDAALAGFQPPHPQYEALKAKLAELRALGSENDRVVIPEGALLKPGMSDERIPLLRKRLGVALASRTVEPRPIEPQTIEPGTEADIEDVIEASAEGAVQPDIAPDFYDEATVAAVEAFQEENGLGVDGIVGPATLLTMNGRSREEDIASIVANMERWRWMPRDLGKFHVMVNVPEFVVRVLDNGTVTHETRVVVGKPQNATPTFSHTMSHLIVNPYWNVPVSILRNEMLPEIQSNPYGYFRHYGYEVLANVGGSFRRIDPQWVDWQRVNLRSVHVRQVPGSHNALGRIKFMFPNQHSVYLHDTPSKSLFNRDRRAFSHGCIRVQNPLEFADALLPVAAPSWNAARLESLFGEKEKRINLDNPVPVHIAYFTTTIEKDGTLRHFDDIYGYDQKMTDFLGF